MNGISAGDSLSEKAQVVINDFENGTINSNTVDSYHKLKANMTSTKTKLSKMKYSHVRTLAKTTYIVPVQDFTASADYEIKRYQLLLVIDEEAANKRYSEAREKMSQLQKLNTASAAFKQNSPKRYKTFAATEEFLLSMQNRIEQLLTEAENTPTVDPDSSSETQEGEEIETVE